MIRSTAIHQNWNVRKPAVEGRNGLVACQHIAAAEAGAKVLREGGNAVDAAIAASFAIGVIEPWMSGVGGGGYLTYYSAKDKTVHTIWFGMKSPAGLKVEDFEIDEKAGVGGDLFSWPKVKGDINVSGAKSICTPGYLAGLKSFHDKWATKKWADLLAPSIAMAEEGLAVTWPTSLRIAAGAAELRNDPDAAAIYLPNGLPPVSMAGQPVKWLELGNLAETLQTIAAEGIGPFYDGVIGEALCADIQGKGGYLAMNDLRDYRSEDLAPLKFQYRDKWVYCVDGVTAGPSMRDAMTALPKMSGNASPRPEDIGKWATALKGAYERRFETMGDLDDSDDPACTTHLTVVDGEGNMVSLTQTLLSIFGSKTVMPSSGLIMNNAVMWFDPSQGKPNSLAPNKKPLSNMAPTVVTEEDGSPYAALGASGGRRIFPCVMQLISMMVDFGMDVEEALHAPRIDVSGTDVALFNPRLGDATEAALEDVLPVRHIEHVYVPSSYACPSIIRVKDDTAIGGADPSLPQSGVVGG